MPVTNYYTVDGQIIGYKTAAGRKDFLTDSLGSVTAEVDQTGATKTFDGRFKPYGGDLSSTGTKGSYGWVGSLGYRGTGLSSADHYVRTRHYSKMTGSWTTVDESWPEESAYSYLNGMVSNSVDPTGMSCGSLLFIPILGFPQQKQKQKQKPKPKQKPKHKRNLDDCKENKADCLRDATNRKDACKDNCNVLSAACTAGCAAVCVISVGFLCGACIGACTKAIWDCYKQCNEDLDSDNKFCDKIFKLCKEHLESY